MSKKNIYIDLFAGCGGLSLGLHNAGWQGLFAIEKSEDAFKTLKYNLIQKKKHFKWPDWLESSHHDINEVLNKHKFNLRSLRGKIDLVAGGPPCQGFSMAGRRNEGDSRNELITSYVNFIDFVRPKMIFFENVKGFTQGFKNNNKKGQAYSERVLKALRNLNYSVEGRLIDFSEYGIPQKRIRFILVGLSNEFLEENNDLTNQTFFEGIQHNRFDFLAKKGLELKPTLQDAISDLLEANGTVESDTPKYRAGVYGKPKSKYQEYLRKFVRNNSKVDSHRFVKHTNQIKKRFQVALDEKLTSVEYRERFNLKKNSTKILESSKPTPTITTLPDDYIHYCEPRIMTVREYARIQSFPDTYHFKGKYTTGGERRTKEVPRYSQIGNAIPPLFAEQAGVVINQMLSND